MNLITSLNKCAAENVQQKLQNDKKELPYCKNCQGQVLRRQSVANWHCAADGILVERLCYETKYFNALF